MVNKQRSCKCSNIHALRFYFCLVTFKSIKHTEIRTHKICASFFCTTFARNIFPCDKIQQVPLELQAEMLADLHVKWSLKLSEFNENLSN